jgi:hypothetical protein
MAGDTLPEIDSDIEISSCQNVISTQCAGETRIDAPSACTDEDGQVPETLANRVEGLTVSGSVSCQYYN